MDKKYVSTTGAADILGISRVAVLKQIKSGRLSATKVGRNYVIHRRDLGGIYRSISKKDKAVVESAVNKLVSDYSSALRRLGKE